MEFERLEMEDWRWKMEDARFALKV